VILNGLWRKTVILFGFSGSKHLPALKDTAKWIMLAFSMLAGGNREKERGCGQLPFVGREIQELLDSWSIPHASRKPQHRPSNLFPSHICGASEWQGTLASESTVPLRASLIHPSMRVFWWDVDPECWPNY
jgi:hypothetical protein